MLEETFCKINWCWNSLTGQFFNIFWASLGDWDINFEDLPLVCVWLICDVEKIFTTIVLQNINIEDLVCADVCLCDLARWLECQNSTNLGHFFCILVDEKSEVLIEVYDRDLLLECVFVSVILLAGWSARIQQTFLNQRILIFLIFLNLISLIFFTISTIFN